MDKYLEYFTNYVSLNYDIHQDLIKSKYEHSLKVARLMTLLSQKLGLSKEDQELAFKIGLCHDLGRFREVTRNGEFNNLVFDHAAYSNKIVYNDCFITYLDIDEEDYLVFRKAIFYHNKKDIGNDLNNRELLFTNMLRDVDKIDLIRVRCNKGMKLEFKREPNKTVLNNYFEGKTIDLKDIYSGTDSAILYLSFIKDLIFDYSFDLAHEEGYVNCLLGIIELDDNMHELMDELLKKILERRNKNVREKIRSFER